MTTCCFATGSCCCPLTFQSLAAPCPWGFWGHPGSPGTASPSGCLTGLAEVPLSRLRASGGKSVWPLTKTWP